MSQAPALSNNQKDWLLCACLSMLALATNLFGEIPIYGSIAIYVGSIFPLFAILVLPLKLSLIVLAASQVGFFMQVSSAVFVFLQVAEFAFIAAFVCFRQRFLFAVFLFWIVIGFPATFILQYSYDFNALNALFLSTTIALNGLVCGITALLTYWFVPSSNQFKRFIQTSPKFANVVFELCIVSVVLPTILVTLVFTWRSTTETESKMSAELEGAAKQFEAMVTTTIERNIYSLTYAVKALDTARSEGKVQDLLNHVANANIDIESMLITDRNANVQAVGPETYATLFSGMGNLNIQHREYFTNTKQYNQPMVSKLLRGQGLGNLNIVSLTAPIQNNGQFDGLIQAAIRLERLIDSRALTAVESSGNQIVITDKEGAVIYASHLLAQPIRSQFDIEYGQHIFIKSAPLLSINDVSYIYRNRISPYGWTIYVMAPPNKVFASILDYSVYIGITILLSFLLITLLAARLAHKITTPLVNLESYINGQENEEKLLADAIISREIKAVAKSLVTARKVDLHFQSELQQQVEEKTKKLNVLNEKLLETSRRDALTGLYNRGAFDTLAENTFQTCVRNKIPFTMVLIDIDLFKNINDTHGHFVGDKCIQHLADVLQTHIKRDSDLVARFGGEEFILLLSGDKYSEHLSFVAKIKEEIANNNIVVQGNVISMTLSAGVVSVRHDFTMGLNDLFKLTDDKLYESKHGGRNKITSIEV
ncbi:MAG: diguanylate cyclase [Glaciecola sp.]